MRGWSIATCVAAAATIALVPSPGVQANGGPVTSFTPLGDLPGGTFRSVAHDVSADGTVVVGESQSGNGIEAFRWTAAGGMEPLGDLTGGSFTSVAYAISGDGNVIVGSSQSAFSAPYQEAFRWTAGGGMVGLGSLLGGLDNSSARGASYDGSLVVGTSGSGAGLFDAFYWTAGDGMKTLSDFGGGIYHSDANDASDDGSIIAGRGHSPNGGEGARWVDRVLSPLGDIPTGNFGSHALACSADGAVLVGIGTSDDGAEAMRWTDAGGVVGLGDFPGGLYSSTARGCSADGSVVVGDGSDDSGVTAFIWDDTNGLRPLRDVLGQLGVHEMKAWSATVANAISADGTVVVGWGVNPSGAEEGWIAVLGEPVVPEGSFLPRKVRAVVKSGSPAKSSLQVKGLIDTGVDPADYSAACTATIGTLALEVPALTAVRGGRRWAYAGNGLKFMLTPSKYGASSAQFKLSFVGDLQDAVPELGTLTSSLDGATLRGTAEVDVLKRRFGLGRGPGDLRAPVFHVFKAKASVKPQKPHKYTLVTCLASAGAAPAMPADFRVVFGDHDQVIPAGSFLQKNGKWTYKATGAGAVRVTIDPAKEQIVVKARGVDLGAFSAPTHVLTVGVAIGATSTIDDLRFGHARNTLRY